MLIEKHRQVKMEFEEYKQSAKRYNPPTNQSQITYGGANVTNVFAYKPQ